MAKRRKRLKQKVLSFADLDGRVRRAWKKHKEPVLYGSVKIMQRTQEQCYQIVWCGTGVRIALACVYAAANGDTAYVVPGVGKSRNNSRSELAQLKVWRRYVGVFTPHDPKHRLTAKTALAYRVRDGSVVYESPQLQDPAALPIGIGVWRIMPPATRPKPAKWIERGDYARYPHSAPRGKRFAARLKRELAEGTDCVMQLLCTADFPRTTHIHAGMRLHVCLPPTETQHGRRLVVTHQHYDCWGWEDGKHWNDKMKWKSGKEAIVGIKEWVLGSIYIPGPE